MTTTDYKYGVLLPDFNIIREQPTINSFGGMRHETATFKAGLL